MRRFYIPIVAALACVAALAVVSSTPAGDFADDPCNTAVGDNYICPTATAGAPYALDIQLKEPWPECTIMSVTSGALPPGLSLSSEGNIRGTPTTPGSYTFFVTVTWKSEGNCYQAPSDRKFTIAVNPGAAAPPPAPTVAVTTTSLPDANVNQPYTAPALAASGAAVGSWTLAGGALPAGLTLAANGVISGTPTQSGLFNVTVQANAGGGSGSKQLTLFVLAPLELQTLVNRTPPERGLTAKKLVGANLTTGVKAVGGRPPYTFSTEGTVPPGLTIDPATGRITGSGTTAGRYAFTETVTDATGATASVEWNITILPLLDFTRGKGLPAGRVDRVYSARIPVRGKDARTAQFAVAGEIPPGLEVAENGRLTGTLMEAGVYRLRVYAFPESGAPITKTFRVRVRG